MSKFFLGKNRITEYYKQPLWEKDLRVGMSIIVRIHEKEDFGKLTFDVLREGKIIVLEIRENSIGHKIITKIMHKGEIVNCEFVEESKNE